MPVNRLCATTLTAAMMAKFDTCLSRVWKQLSWYRCWWSDTWWCSDIIAMSLNIIFSVCKILVEQNIVEHSRVGVLMADIRSDKDLHHGCGHPDNCSVPVCRQPLCGQKLLHRRLSSGTSWILWYSQQTSQNNSPVKMGYCAQPLNQLLIRLANYLFVWWTLIPPKRIISSFCLIVHSFWPTIISRLVTSIWQTVTSFRWIVNWWTINSFWEI